MRFILIRAAAAAALEATGPWPEPSDAGLLFLGRALSWTSLAPQACFVIPLLESHDPVPLASAPPTALAVATVRP